MADALRPGYLDPATLTHARRNIHDCCTDPGPLTHEQALQAQRLHHDHLPVCQVQRRVVESLSSAGRQQQGEVG
ncbi:hypothetical protein [Nocardia sp. NPDC004260]